MATEDKTPLWKTALKLLVFSGVMIGLPVYFSTDGFLTWLYEKAYKDNWKNAATVTYNCAGYYRLTLRSKRAAEVYEKFFNRWPEHDLAPDAAYNTASALREHANDLDLTAKGSPEMVQMKQEYRAKAELWFDWFAANYPGHLKAETARKAAQQLRDGY